MFPEWSEWHCQAGLKEGWIREAATHKAFRSKCTCALLTTRAYGWRGERKSDLQRHSWREFRPATAAPPPELSFPGKICTREFRLSTSHFVRICIFRGNCRLHPWRCHSVDCQIMQYSRSKQRPSHKLKWGKGYQGAWKFFYMYRYCILFFATDVIDSIRFLKSFIKRERSMGIHVIKCHISFVHKRWVDS